MDFKLKATQEVKLIVAIEGQTIFNLSFAPAGTVSTSIGGVDIVLAHTVVGTVLTFTVGHPAGTEVIFKYIK